MALQEELKKQGDFLFKYRSYFPLLLIIMGLFILTIKPFGINKNNDLFLSDFLKQIAIYVGLLGLFIRAYTIGYNKKHTSGRNTSAGQVAESLNTDGIYSITRNPLYLGNYFMWLSLSMLTGFLGFAILFSLIFWLYYERIIYAEEQFLRTKFGDKYLVWSKQTAIFFPKKLKISKNKIDYDWKDVLKRERNGLIALFMLFYIFTMLENYIDKNSISFELSFISIGFYFSVLFFIVVKTLQKKTKYLD